MLDKYYTPKAIAELMINSTRVNSPSRVADFASGDGILLNLAKNSWPQVALYANDISLEALSYVKNELKDCQCENIDFLSNEARVKSTFFTDLISGIDLILLNPPYSYRGQFKFKFSGNKHISCPRSLAFVLISTEYLSKNGELIALLPSGAIYGVRGREALNLFNEKYHIEIIDKFPDNAFNLCSAKTVLVRFSNRKEFNKEIISSKKIAPKYSVIRGGIQMHKVVRNNESKYKIIHSTSIQKNDILPIKINNIENARTISGYNVLIQRVGNIKKHKIVNMIFEKEIMISDCIISIQTSSDDESRFIVDYIHSRWDEFLSFYVGTCAKHLTLHNLNIFLAQCPTYVNTNRYLLAACDM